MSHVSIKLIGKVEIIVYKGLLESNLIKKIFNGLLFKTKNRDLTLIRRFNFDLNMVTVAKQVISSLNRRIKLNFVINQSKI
jgi:hypothetical protein